MSSEYVTKLARRHAHKIVRLPEPPDTFALAETDMDVSDLKMFKLNGLITRESDGERPHRWAVVPRAYEKAMDYVEKTDTFPCCNASRGVSNVGGELHCMNCGEVVPKDVFQKVMN